LNSKQEAPFLRKLVLQRWGLCDPENRVELRFAFPPYYLLDGAHRYFYVGPRHVQMGHGPQAGGTGLRDSDTALHKHFLELGSRQPCVSDVEKDEVGLDRFHVNSVGIAQALSQDLGIVVVLGKTLDVVLEGVECSDCDDTCLPHGSAKLMLPAPGPLDELLGASQRRPDRSTQALAEIDPDRIHVRCVLVGRDASSNYCVEQPGAIHVTGQALGPGKGADLGDGLQGPDRTTSHV
jgi:hypothetical protein